MSVFQSSPLLQADLLMVLYYSILLGFLASYINCDLQRMINDKPFVVHIIGFMCMLFIYITQDTKLPISSIFLRTLFIYFIYVLITKSKWYFALTSISILLGYGLALRYFIMQKRDSKMEVTNESVDTSSDDTNYTDYPPYDEDYEKRVLNIIRLILLLSIILGTIQYAYLQYIEYGSKFSLITFFIGTGKCKKKSPKY